MARVPTLRGAAWLMVAVLGVAACGSGASGTDAAGPTTAPDAGGATTAAPEDGDVVIVVRDFEFVPSTVTVASGTRIVIRNEGSVQHSMISDDVSSFNTTPIDPGGEEAIFAVVPGTYPFHCELHPNTMKGTLTITE